MAGDLDAAGIRHGVRRSLRRSRPIRKCALGKHFDNLLTWLSGSEDPSPDLLRRARNFVDTVNSPEFSLMGKDRDKVYHRKQSKIVPKHARAGSGALWLKMFRDYEGDKCLIFPFGTAANPRGRVTYNFKSMEAHRAMCIMAHKLPSEDGKTMALHSCGNGHLGCVNPKHLYWGDHGDNVKDGRRHAKEGRKAA